MADVRPPRRLIGRVVLTVAAVAAAVILYQGWMNSRSVDGLALIEGRGLIIEAQRKFHRARRMPIPDWEEICALFQLEVSPKFFRRCFSPREFAALKLETQSNPIIRIWVRDPQCGAEPRTIFGGAWPRNPWGMACDAEQIEVAGKLVATPGSAPSCSVFGGSCPPLELGARDWKDIKQFPPSVQVGLLKKSDGAPRHYLAAEYGLPAEWVEYRHLGFDGASGSINISRGGTIFASPDRAMIDIRALQDEIFMLPGVRYSASVPLGSFQGLGFRLMRGGSRHECVFYAGAVEREEFAIRGWYCVPKGEMLSETIIQSMLESIEVLPPARTRL